MELGSVTLKRIGFFCFPIKHSTHTQTGADPEIILSVLLAQLVGRLGSDGFWKEDYGWGVRVRRPFGACGRSSVRYGTRLGDLKESWFIFFFN